MRLPVWIVDDIWPNYFGFLSKAGVRVGAMGAWHPRILKFMYSEKVTKFDENSILFEIT